MTEEALEENTGRCDLYKGDTDLRFSSIRRLVSVSESLPETLALCD